MSKYLRITNNGVCDPRVFTMLGVSSAREDSSKIGQFGSGSKHGMLIALRTGTECIIKTGRTTIRPKTKDVMIHNKLYQAVSFQFSDEEKEWYEPSSMTLDFGSLDWKEAYMMVREFISNALDATDQDWSRMSVSLVDDLQTSPDTTNIFLQLTPEVRRVFANIDEYFLHTRKLHNERVLTKEPSGVKLYRMGVFINKGERILSIFDYNGESGMQIDESRNMESYDLRRTCANILFSSPNTPERIKIDALKKIILLGVAGKEYLEHHFSAYFIPNSCLETACNELYGEDAVYAISPLMAEQCKKQGNRVILFPIFMDGIYQALYYTKCKRADKIVCEQICNMKGLVKQRTLPTVSRVINALHKMRFIDKDSKPLPKVFTYQNLQHDGGSVLGYTDGKDIYLNEENKNNIVVILEEVLHLYTGYEDCTRDFQDVIFKVAGYLLERKIQRQHRKNITA